MRHEVKSWPQFFTAIMEGKKTHDLRHNDRYFNIGDTLFLGEFNPTTGKYTGRYCEVEITYITSRDFPCAFSSAILDRDYCILSIKRVGQ